MFDQTNEKKSDERGNLVFDDTPVRFKNNGISLSYCYSDAENTNGEVLYSGSYMSHQLSCKSNSNNGGNYYNWYTSTAGSKQTLDDTDAPNSICAKNWKLSSYSTADSAESKNYHTLLRFIYGITDIDNDEKARTMPFSFMRQGYYYNSIISSRGISGLYWTSRVKSGSLKYDLYLNTTKLSTGDSTGWNYGVSLRCVAR